MTNYEVVNKLNNYEKLYLKHKLSKTNMKFITFFIRSNEIFYNFDYKDSSLHKSNFTKKYSFEINEILSLLK